MVDWVKIVFYVTVMVLIALGNSGLLFLLTRSPELQTKSNHLIGALAADDLFLCFVIPLDLVDDYTPNNPFLCLLSSGFLVLQVSTSSLLLVTIAIERYIAIFQPLHYNSWVTIRRIKIAIVIIVVYTVVISFVPAFAGWNAFQYRADHNLNWTGLEGCHLMSSVRASYLGFIVLGHVYPSMLLMVVLYSKILYTVYKQNKVFKVQTQSQHPQLANTNPQITRRRRSRFLREQRGVIVMVVLVVYFIISWLPMTTTYLITFQWFRKEVMTRFLVPVATNNVVVMMAFSNSAVNPYLYGFSHKDVRRAAKKHYGKYCCLCKAKVTAENSTESAYTLQLNERTNQIDFCTT